MLDELQLLWKRLAARLADVWSAAVVNAHMLREHALERKPLVADETNIWPLLHVGNGLNIVA